MATITSNTFFDVAATARTAGETMTINGGILTVRTDTRWHVNSAVSMTGTLGAVTISSTLGGGYYIDGTAVRWLPYDGGAGNVPPVGTTITGGTSGSTGYLLGVWASLTAAPTAVGAAMPAAGFIKFREVSAPFVDNDVLSGSITATANGVDVVGWIEVVHDQSVAITVPRIGEFQTRGAWFDLGTTTGAANQLVTLPTNGSTTTYTPGVWIATTGSPTTDDDYEFWPAIPAALFITTNFGTDARSKFVCMETNGQIRIGHNGTGAVGNVPAASRAIRVPNVFLRHAATATRATNVLPSSTLGTRPDFVTTSAGYIDMENCLCDWYLQFQQPYYVKMHRVATFDTIDIQECATAFSIVDSGAGISQTMNNPPITLLSNRQGGTVSKFIGSRYANTNGGTCVSLTSCSNITLDRLKTGCSIQYSRGASATLTISGSDNITITNTEITCATILLSSSFNISANNIDYCDRWVANTITTSAYSIVATTLSSNCTFNNITVGKQGTISTVTPYAACFTANNSTDIRFRNFGTRSAMISAAGIGANTPVSIFSSGGNNQRIKVQRAYLTPTRTSAIVTINSDYGNEFYDVYGDFADTATIAGIDHKVKKLGGTTTTTGQTSVYGTHFYDVFTSDTTGHLVLACNETTAASNSYITKVAGNPLFTSSGSVILAAVNDEVIFEMDYYALGITALTNSAPLLSGTNVTYSSGARWGNHDVYYQLDPGTGVYGGSWQNLTAANLSAETVSPSVGFRIKIRVVCATAATTNLITFIRILTTSTLAAQRDNLYPLDLTTLTLTGLVSGSDIVVLDAGTETERVNVNSNSGTTYPFIYSTTGNVDIGVFKTGYVPFYIRNYPLTTQVASLPVAQIVDRNYSNP